MISESPSVRFGSDNLRFGATADDIVDIYLGEFSIGAPMRDGTDNLMRWWIGIDIHRSITHIPNGNPRESAACV